MHLSSRASEYGTRYQGPVPLAFLMKPSVPDRLSPDGLSRLSGLSGCFGSVDRPNGRDRPDQSARPDGPGRPAWLAPQHSVLSSSWPPKRRGDFGLRKGVCIGPIHLQNDKLIPRPASSIAFKNVLADTVEVYVDGKRHVYSVAHVPELSSKSLPRACHGSYFHVGKLEED